MFPQTAHAPSPRAPHAIANMGPKESETITREEWLVRAAHLIAPWFAEAGYPLPAKVRYSISFPGGGSKFKRIGECWSPKASADGTTEIFLTPAIDDLTTILATLVHEQVHAAVGVEAGHKSPFQKAAKAMGLTGKWTATVATEELKARLKSEVIDELPEFPHKKLNLSMRKKQTTRMIKAECPECGYTVRMSQKWIDEVGLPHCPHHGEMVEG